MTDRETKPNEVTALKNGGCSGFCREAAIAGELLSDVRSRGQDELIAEAGQYVKDHPCKFVLEGNCRLAEFFLRRELGLSLTEHHYENPRMKKT